MSKRTFVIYGLLILALAVLVPWLAFRSDGDADTGPDSPRMERARTLFDTNCGTCHTLYAAGTDGNFGPDLDQLLAPAGPPSGENAEDTVEQTKGRVLNAIVEGVDGTTTTGRMPPGILSGERAELVSEYVARVAGSG